jgi:hypothetical protein
MYIELTQRQTFLSATASATMRRVGWPMIPVLYSLRDRGVWAHSLLFGRKQVLGRLRLLSKSDEYGTTYLAACTDESYNVGYTNKENT